MPMPTGEKRVAALLVVVLLAMIAVYFGTSGRPAGPVASASLAQGALTGAGVAGGGSDPGCAPGVGGPAAGIQEFGKEGARLEIIAVLPVAQGCHATTEAEVKKAYKKHPDDIHLTIVDLMSPEAAKYRDKVGVPWMVVSINGESTFEIKGRRVQLQRMENGSYKPSDIVPIIEAELKKLRS